MMKLSCVVLLMLVMMPVLVHCFLENLNIESLALGAEGMKDSASKPIPAEFKKYFKQADPFMKLLAMKLKGDECKKELNEFGKFLKEAGSKKSTILAGHVLREVCGLTSDCVSEMIDAAAAFVEGNALMKNGADGFLKKYGLELDTVKPLLPIAFSTLCTSMDDMFESLGEDDEVQEKEEL